MTTAGPTPQGVGPSLFSNRTDIQEMTPRFPAGFRHRGIAASQDFWRNWMFERAAFERNRLCRPPGIPPYLGDRLGRRARRDLAARHSATPIYPDDKMIRLILETGVEVRFTPGRQHLRVDILYHYHPWTAGGRPGSFEVLHAEDIPWQNLLGTGLSAHEKIAFLAGRRDLDHRTGEIFLSGAMIEQKHFLYGQIPVHLMRNRFTDLWMVIGHDTGNFTVVPREERKSEAPIGPEAVPGMEKDRSLRFRIATAARRTDAAYVTLPLWRRLILLAKARIGPIFQKAADGICALPHRVSKYSKAKEH